MDTELTIFLKKHLYSICSYLDQLRSSKQNPNVLFINGQLAPDKNLGNQGTHNLIVRPSLVVFIVFFTKKIRNIRTTIQKTWDKFNVMKIRIILVISFNPLWADFADQKLILIVCNLLNRFLFSETSFCCNLALTLQSFLEVYYATTFFYADS